ncbi:ABC transporter permease [Pedobacter nototheniae]|uniref:ABC transporter permease n=1 Tax=Pedobacter nototheniae TaxID=2488994 RepID=UPI00292E9A9A|nr:ABC transporter permease [Pedobacter nototheniae]
MLKLNFKVAFRNLLRHKTNSIINISGLSIGLAASILLLLYVEYQWNFDKQFGNTKNIYHLMLNFYGANKNVISTGSQAPNVLPPLLKEQNPEIENISRILWESNRLLANGQNSFKIAGRYADPDFLKIFRFDYLSGNPDKAFDDPNSIILTESTARRLFGKTEVLNKTIRFENQVNLKVTGVIKDLPANFTYSFECLSPWKLYENLNEWPATPNWGNCSYFTVMSIKSGTDPNAFNEKIKNFISKNTGTNTLDAAPFIYPIEKYHLFGHFTNGLPDGGQIEQVRIFIILALSILLIACINFMNLSTARSQKRGKEVGLRKTIGASRSSLIRLFLLESLILTVISVTFAIVMVEVFLPSFNNLLNTSLQINYNSFLNWLAVLLLILFTGLIAGGYPAFFLSSFNPVQALKKSVKSQRKFGFNFRQILVIIQFGFAVVMILSTLILYQQLMHLKNRSLGYDTTALVEMPHEGNLYPKFDLFKDRLLRSGAVTAVAQSSGSIARQNSNTSGLQWQGMRPGEEKISFDIIQTTFDFIKTNNIRLVAGRDFVKGRSSDSSALMLNETAVKKMGLKNPLEQQVFFNGKKRPVVGVFDDIVWDEPTKSQHPMVIVFNAFNSDVITMRLNTTRNTQESIDQITKITKEINPDFPVEIKFVDNLVAEKFEHEQTLTTLSNLFGGLSIFVSCLGLFGLSAFTAEQRTKEIGVRKVLGASVSGIIALLSLSFVKAVVIAIVIALPIGYLVMNQWLMQFDYRILIGPEMFVITALSTVLIAFFTVSWQAYRAAKTNPAEALKYE